MAPKLSAVPAISVAIVLIAVCLYLNNCADRDYIMSHTTLCQRCATINTPGMLTSRPRITRREMQATSADANASLRSVDAIGRQFCPSPLTVFGRLLARLKSHCRMTRSRYAGVRVFLRVKKYLSFLQKFSSMTLASLANVDMSGCDNAVCLANKLDRGLCRPRCRTADAERVTTNPTVLRLKMLRSSCYS